MRMTNAIALATMFFLSPAAVGLAEGDCIKCSQNYRYSCIQDYGECADACRSIGATDKDFVSAEMHHARSGVQRKSRLQMRNSLLAGKISYSAACA